MNAEATTELYPPRRCCAGVYCPHHVVQLLSALTVLLLWAAAPASPGPVAFGTRPACTRDSEQGQLWQLTRMRDFSCCMSITMLHAVHQHVRLAIARLEYQRMS